MSMYKTVYKESIEEPDTFWKREAKRLDWITPPDKTFEGNFSKGDISWFADGKLNACYNCVDRHVKNGRGETSALIWENDSGTQSTKITYTMLLEKVQQCANVLKKTGVKKGDSVVLYMPMIPEAIYMMLACARIGAVHSVVFAGFSAESLAKRIIDCKAKLIVTTTTGRRGGKILPLSETVVNSLTQVTHDTTTLIITHPEDGSVEKKEHKNIVYFEDVAPKVSDTCPCEEMNSEDRLFILYTSGSTGTPKGIVHTTGGYLVYASLTHQWVFDYKQGDVYWCNADIGWITGHTYVVYGPLSNGATVVIQEGTPFYPTPSRCWEIIDKYNVRIFYTSPTAIRALKKEGDSWVSKTSRKSLEILGSVGEPLNPAAWEWYHDVVGEKRCFIVDTWWQTETGGILLTPLPGQSEMKAGSVSFPFFGVEPCLLGEDGKEIHGTGKGYLCVKGSWPGQSRTLHGDHDRFLDTYFNPHAGHYFSSDASHRDEEGFYHIIGRVDDVINVSGHRLGTAEIEHALVKHTHVAEAAVVGIPHDIKGEGIYAYVTLHDHERKPEDIEKELISWVRKEIGPIATIDIVHLASSLPKTRSGKIMRRILRCIAHDKHEDIGDVSTLANPESVQNILDTKTNQI